MYNILNFYLCALKLVGPMRKLIGVEIAQLTTKLVHSVYFLCTSSIAIQVVVVY